MLQVSNCADLQTKPALVEFENCCTSRHTGLLLKTVHPGKQQLWAADHQAEGKGIVCCCFRDLQLM